MDLQCIIAAALLNDNNKLARDKVKSFIRFGLVELKNKLLIGLLKG
jgi:hypothetical protein